jgi:hypothetical protein
VVFLNGPKIVLNIGHFTKEKYLSVSNFPHSNTLQKTGDSCIARVFSEIPPRLWPYATSAHPLTTNWLMYSSIAQWIHTACWSGVSFSLSLSLSLSLSSWAGTSVPDSQDFRLSTCSLYISVGSLDFMLSWQEQIMGHLNFTSGHAPIIHTKCLLALLCWRTLIPVEHPTGQRECNVVTHLQEDWPAHSPSCTCCDSYHILLSRPQPRALMSIRT